MRRAPPSTRGGRGGGPRPGHPHPDGRGGPGRPPDSATCCARWTWWTPTPWMALWRAARRQRRSLRPELLAGRQLPDALPDGPDRGGQPRRAGAGPVRVIDRLAATPHEAVYRVFDPRRDGEALLRHLAEAEMHGRRPPRRVPPALRGRRRRPAPARGRHPGGARHRRPAGGGAPGVAARPHAQRRLAGAGRRPRRLVPPALPGRPGPAHRPRRRPGTRPPGAVVVRVQRRRRPQAVWRGRAGLAGRT